MTKISKKQRSSLKEIELLMKKIKKDRTKAIASILVMIVLIVLFNTLGYQLEIIDANNAILRAMMYITALVFAGYSGIKLMKVSQNQRTIDGYRQQSGISRETLEAWKMGELE